MQLKQKLFFLCVLLVTQESFGQFQLGNFSLADSTDQWYDGNVSMIGTDLMVGEYYRFELVDRYTYPMLGAFGWSKGNVFYRGQQFLNVSLAYDQQHDVLVLQNLENTKYFNYPIKLNSEQVKHFEIYDRKFRRFEQSDGLSTGFYEVLFESQHILFLAKRTKVKEIGGGTIQFVESPSFYFQFDDRTVLLRTKRTIVKLFPESKKELKRYFTSQRIKKFDAANIQQLYDLGLFVSQILTAQ